MECNLQDKLDKDTILLNIQDINNPHNNSNLDSNQLLQLFKVNSTQEKREKLVDIVNYFPHLKREWDNIKIHIPALEISSTNPNQIEYINSPKYTPSVSHKLRQFTKHSALTLSSVAQSYHEVKESRKNDKSLQSIDLNLQYTFKTSFDDEIHSPNSYDIDTIYKKLSNHIASYDFSSYNTSYHSFKEQSHDMEMSIQDFNRCMKNIYVFDCNWTEIKLLFNDLLSRLQYNSNNTIDTLNGMTLVHFILNIRKESSLALKTQVPVVITNEEIEEQENVSYEVEDLKKIESILYSKLSPLLLNFNILDDVWNQRMNSLGFYMSQAELKRMFDRLFKIKLSDIEVSYANFSYTQCFYC